MGEAPEALETSYGGFQELRVPLPTETTVHYYSVITQGSKYKKMFTSGPKHGDYYVHVHWPLWIPKAITVTSMIAPRNETPHFLETPIWELALPTYAPKTPGFRFGCRP